MPHASWAQQETEQKIHELCEATKAFIGRYDQKHADMQSQLNAIDEMVQARRFSNGGDAAPVGAKAICDEFEKHIDGLKSAGRCRFEVPTRAVLGTKSTITSTGNFVAAPSGGPIPTGQYPYMLRSMIRNEPVNTGSIFVHRQTGTTGEADVQSPEAGEKSEVTFSFDGVTETVPTVAAWVAVTKQALDDVVGLRVFLDQTLLWLLEKKIETQLLDGNGVGAIRGLKPFATAYNSALSGSSFDRAKILSGALAQVQAAGFAATHMVLHPYDIHHLRTTRSTTGEYCLVLPTGAGGMSQLWSGSIIPSDRQTEGEFTVFDINQLLMRERMAMTIDISESHSDFFTKNKVAIRAEWRGQLVLGQSAAIVDGSLTTSPAS